MKTIYCVFFIILFLTLNDIVAGQTVFKSDINDQTAVEVTVYNNNLGLVKDIRKITLPVGNGELRFMDVASHIMPVTVHVKSGNNPELFSVLEQNYEYDLMNADRLLDKYVGKKVKIVDWNRYQDRKEEVDAILLSNNKGQIFKINDEIYLGHPGYKVLPEIPENLIAKPTLSWLYENRATGAHEIEVSYLTKKISWKADYVLVLNRDDTAADLSGWVTLDNKSGAMYKDAVVKLVAGQVHRVKEEYERLSYAIDTKKVAGASQFRERPFFEYHIYDLQRKTTIKDKQTKQISLLKAGNIGIHKELLVRGTKGGFFRKHRGVDSKQPVAVYIKFDNSEENNLGMPLPSGIMRIYKEDNDESLQFVGEDRIGHTPRDEEVSLKLGEAFDVVAERVQTDYRQLSSRLHESEWEITLRNHKKKDVVVTIEEPMPGNWKVIKSTHSYRKIDAFTIRFDVSVPRDKEIKVNYRIRVGM